MKTIILLVSYPKSGNTWYRAFITSLMNAGGEVNLNNMLGFTIGRNRLKKVLGYDTSMLEPTEIKELMPIAYKEIATSNNELKWCKIHNAFDADEALNNFFLPEYTKAVVHIVRNPLDVSVSLGKHLNITIDAAIDFMANPNSALADSRNKLNLQLEQKLSSWSQHFACWNDQSDYNSILLRYEDIVEDSFKEFKRSLDFLEIEADEEIIKKAIEASSFSRLQDVEQTNGFTEKPGCLDHFFNVGKVGNWKNVLSDAQVNQIIDDHGKVMKRLGYL